MKLAITKDVSTLRQVDTPLMQARLSSHTSAGRGEQDHPPTIASICDMGKNHSYNITIMTLPRHSHHCHHSQNFLETNLVQSSFDWTSTHSRLDSPHQWDWSISPLPHSCYILCSFDVQMFGSIQQADKRGNTWNVGEPWHDLDLPPISFPEETWCEVTTCQGMKAYRCFSDPRLLLLKQGS